MATASGNYRNEFLATLLSALLVTGCVAGMPVKFEPYNAGDGTDQGRGPLAGAVESVGQPSGSSPVMSADTGEDTPRQLSLASGAAPLPRQEYDASGARIPYVPQPNPYTSSSTALPTEAKSMFVAASARLGAGDLASAQAKFEQLAEKYPQLSGPWVKLGEIAERREQYDVAIGHYRHAISVNSNNVNAYIALGMAQRRQGRFNDAQDTYLAALDVWKDFPEAHLNLAILYDLYGNQPAAAQRHYEAYDFLTGGKDEKSHKWLAEVRQRTGMEQSFIDAPPIVVEIVPADKADDNSVAAAPGTP